MSCPICGQSGDGYWGHREPYPNEYRICSGTSSPTAKAARYAAEAPTRDAKHYASYLELSLRAEKLYRYGDPNLAAKPNRRLAKHHASEVKRLTAQLEATPEGKRELRKIREMATASAATPRSEP